VRLSKGRTLTVVQWDDTLNAGFTTGTPWIRVNDDYKTWNAATQVATPGSVFEYWRSALMLRKDLKDTIIYGDFEMLDAENDDIFAYARSNGKQKVVVVCSFRDREIDWLVPAYTDIQSGKVLLSNYPDVDLSQDMVTVRPFEAFVCLVG
jgi:glycosidase